MLLFLGDTHQNEPYHGKLATDNKMIQGCSFPRAPGNRTRDEEKIEALHLKISDLTITSGQWSDGVINVI